MYVTCTWEELRRRPVHGRRTRERRRGLGRPVAVFVLHTASQVVHYLTHLAQHNWSLFEYSEFLDLHNVVFHFVSSPGFEQEWPEATHALELLACTSASHQCCVSSSISIIHFVPPN